MNNYHNVGGLVISYHKKHLLNHLAACAKLPYLLCFSHPIIYYPNDLFYVHFKMCIK